MTDAKRLLADATPLPWWLGDDGTIRSDHGEIGYIDVPDGPIVVYVVNHLPDYLAAVDALERLAKASEMARRNLQGTTPCYCASSPHDEYCGELLHATANARAALARLRDEVTA